MLERTPAGPQPSPRSIGRRVGTPSSATVLAREDARSEAEQLASLIPLTLATPEPRHAHCGAEFPGVTALPLAMSID
jgi:hypothetical protein